MSKAQDDPALESFIAHRGIREGIREKGVGGCNSGEQEHFYSCPACGQRVDKRDLSAVLHHEQPQHAPLTRP